MSEDFSQPTYNLDQKREALASFFFSENKKIGRNVVDVGSGEKGLGRELLHDEAGRKILHIDARDIPQIQGKHASLHQRVQFDLNSKTSEEFKKLLTQAKDFYAPADLEKQCIDTMIFSDILNYVDYEKVLRTAAHFLKSGGLFIILNRADRGISTRFTNPNETGPEADEKLRAYALGLGFKVYKEYDKPIELFQSEKVPFLVLEKV